MSGPLILVGGEAFTQPFDKYHLRFFRAAATDTRATVVFLPTAAEIFPNDDTVDAAYRLARMATVATVPARTRDEAANAETAAGVAAADVIYLGDGDSGRLVRTLVGTTVGEAIAAAYAGGATLIGAGAGAAAFCTSVPARPDDVPARPGEPFFRWFPGFDLLRGVTVLPRYNRTPEVWLRSLRENAPTDSPLLGIDDVTALVWDGTTWKVMGYGRVVLDNGHTFRTFGANEQVPIPPPAA